MAHPIITAQDALKALLTARPAYATTDVRDGSPTEGEDVTASAFWFNDVTVPRDGWASLGASRRRIEFQIGFTIAVRLYGDDEHAARLAVLDLYEDLMVTVKANPALGVPAVVRQVNDVTGTFTSAPVEQSQWGAFFTGSLSVTSRDY